MLTGHGMRSATAISAGVSHANPHTLDRQGSVACLDVVVQQQRVDHIEGGEGRAPGAPAQAELAACLRLPQIWRWWAVLGPAWRPLPPCLCPAGPLSACMWRCRDVLTQASRCNCLSACGGLKPWVPSCTAWLKPLSKNGIAAQGSAKSWPGTCFHIAECVCQPLQARSRMPGPGRSCWS